MVENDRDAVGCATRIESIDIVTVHVDDQQWIPEVMGIVSPRRVDENQPEGRLEPPLHWQ